MVAWAWTASLETDLQSFRFLPGGSIEENHSVESLKSYHLNERAFMIRKLGRKLASGMRSFRPRRWIGVTAILGVSLLSFWGCGGDASRAAGPLYPVTGKVILPDGKPLTTGRVEFIPASSGLPAFGALGSDGSFSLKTGDGREGAPAGDYKVRLEPTTVAAKKAGKLASLPFPAKYFEEDGNTGLTAKVLAEPTTLEPFKLTSDSAAPKAAARDHD